MLIGLSNVNFGSPSVAFGQSIVPPSNKNSSNRPENHNATSDASEAQLRQAVQWLADLAVKKLPASFKGDKDWGDQKKVWAGVDIKRDGLRLRTHRKYRHVDHGRWFRYEVFPKRPAETAQGPVQVRLTIHRVRQDNDRWTIESTVIADADFTTQLQRWNFGLKLYSVSTRGRLQVRMDTTMSVALKGDYSNSTPSFVLDPKVVVAKLTLQKFDLDRVSHVGGEVAEEIGVVVERNIKRFWLEKLNDKLVGKLNRSIDKNRDDLQWSMSNIFSTWNLSP